jgi:hypothetical protein
MAALGIFKVVFRSGNYQLKLGGQSCVESKLIKEKNEKMYGEPHNTLDTSRYIMGKKKLILLFLLLTRIFPPLNGKPIMFPEVYELNKRARISE